MMIVVAFVLNYELEFKAGLRLKFLQIEIPVPNLIDIV